MKTHDVALLSLAFALGGCAQDIGTESMRKGEVDVAGFTTQAQVAVDGAIGSVVVPFSTPLPNVPTDEFIDAMDGAVTMRVVSNASGAAADLMVGQAVDVDPTGPGQFSWSMSSDRTQATFVFYNETEGGMSLSPGATYTVQFSITANDYVERVSSMSFEITVGE
jgi:hypothetical protein